MSIEGYLVDLPSREREAYRRLLEIPLLAEEMMAAFGLGHPFAWYVLELQTHRLVPGIIGEIDILAGQLAWREPTALETYASNFRREHPEVHPSRSYDFGTLVIAGAGGLLWPPPLDRLIGIEAKCARLPRTAEEISEASIKGQKASKGQVREVRLQIDRDLSLGFDYVGLLDIISNPPIGGRDGEAWLRAGAVAVSSSRAIERTLKERLEPESPVGHWVYSPAAVQGADESWRGGGIPIQLRRALRNPRLDTEVGLGRREEVARNLRSLLSGVAQPRSIPVIITDCLSCRRLHLLGPCP